MKIAWPARKWGTLSTLGWLVGVSLLPFGLYIYNKSHGNDGYKHVDSYISKSTDLKLTISDPKVTETDVQGNTGRSGTNHFYRIRLLFHSTIYAKYFAIEFFTGGGSEATSYSYFLEHIHNGEVITATINQTELSDPSFGKKDKPIPIFSFSRDGVAYDKTYAYYSSEGGRIDNRAEIEKLYRGSIGVYLSHVKSKEDFERMFGMQ